MVEQLLTLSVGVSVCLGEKSPRSSGGCLSTVNSSSNNRSSSDGKCITTGSGSNVSGEVAPGREEECGSSDRTDLS